MDHEARNRQRIVEFEQEWKHLSERLKVTRTALRDESDETQVAVLQDRLQSLIEERRQIGEELDRLEQDLHRGPGSCKPRGKNIFISYKRNSEPDESVAMYIVRFLSDRGHHVFIDQKINVGMEWVEEIYDQISRSDFQIVLLSPASYKSEMVLEEVKFADQQWRAIGKPRILPVRLNDEGPLPYALGEYLKPLQYALWQEEKDTVRIAHNILNVMSGQHVLPRQLVKESFDQRATFQLLIDHFNESELRDLCFQLQIDHENLTGSTKLDKARELIAYCDRRDKLAELVDEMDKQRPRLSVSARVIHLSEPSMFIQSMSETRTQEGATLAEPLPNFDPRLILEPPTGLVDLESPFYIERHADIELSRQDWTRGETATIRAPRQMGKTSLLVRRVDFAKQQGLNTIFLDFQMIDKTYLEDLDAFLFYIARLTATLLNLDPADVTTMWQSPLSPKDRLTLYFEDHVLKQTQKSVILAIDEADRLLESTFYQEFFGLIRAWDTRRGYNASWKKLSVIMVISTQPFLLIENINQSPFNVGRRVELEDFDLEQIEELNRRHGSPISPGELVEAKAFLGGHPYLVRQALYTLVDQTMTWSKFVQSAAEESGPYSSHLRHYLWQLHDHPELIDALKRILANQECRDERIAIRLNAAGLIKRDQEGKWRFRCQLYEKYFGGYLA